MNGQNPKAPEMLPRLKGASIGSLVSPDQTKLTIKRKRPAPIGELASSPKQPDEPEGLVEMDAGLVRWLSKHAYLR